MLKKKIFNYHSEHLHQRCLILRLSLKLSITQKVTCYPRRPEGWAQLHFPPLDLRRNFYRVILRHSHNQERRLLVERLFQY